MTQLLELQRAAHVAGIDPQTPLAVRAALMRAWCDLQEERRKLQMRPLPKSIDVSKMSKAKQRNTTQAAFQEPDEKGIS